MEIFNPLRSFLDKANKRKRWQEVQRLKGELDQLHKENPLLTKAQKDIIWRIRGEYAERQRETMIKYLRQEVGVLKDIKLKLQK